MNYKLLALDMDGTILNSEKKISPKTAEAILKLSKSDVVVTLSTGRGLAELADYKTELKFIHYGILVSGGMVYDFFNSKPVISHPLEIKTLDILIDIAEQENAMIQLLTESDSVTREEDILNMEIFGMGIYQDMYYRNCVRCNDFREYIRENPDKILKFNIYHRSTESREKNFKRLEGLNLAIDYAEKTALEITLKNISKASGLKELCKFLGIEISQTVAVGDAENDIAILQVVGFSVAMGNASEKIKKLADFVTVDNDNDGVAKVIEQFF